MNGRAQALRLSAVWIDDPHACRIVCDAVIGADDRIMGEWPLFGATDPGSPEARPFLIDAQGRFVFGCEGRDWRTDLRLASTRVGECFSVWWNRSESGLYRIVKRAAPGSKARPA